MPETGAPSSAAIEAVRSLARVSRLVERASEGLSLADYRVLSAIVGGEGRASRLASRLALGKPAISASIDSLSRRGLVLRSSVEGDNRAVALSLSAEGAELFARVEGSMAGQLERLSELTPDAARVLESLAWLGDAIEAAAVERRVTAELGATAERGTTAERAAMAEPEMTDDVETGAGK